MAFTLNNNEKIVWNAETRGEQYSVWPVIDDGNPHTDDELTDRTFEYRQSIGIKRVTNATNRFDITRNSKEAVNVWLKAHGFNFTFDDILLQKNQ
jgi:hypothetical protein